jgi:proteasome accessory factor C
MSRPAADERMRRILAVVPWVAAADGPEIAEVCRRFGYASEQELHADFDLLFMCGVHPYTPDSLIEIDISDGRVWVRYADWFSRPLRLSPAEGLSLVASSAALLGTEGYDSNGPLARGLAKLAAVLGIDPEEVVDVELGPAEPDTLAILRAASVDHHQVEIEYYGFGRDARTTRIIDPYVVYSAAGQWYVAAYCHRAQDRRLFRVDRIEAARALPATFEPPAAPATSAELPTYDPGPEDPLIVLELEPEAGWVAEQYPAESVRDLGQGRRRVALRVSGAAWLERLLLRLGPSARVVEGDAGPGRVAAERVLARYR